jgi:hypothetical protein
MAGSGAMVPPFCRDNPGACCGVTLRALQWGLDPFSVASKAYQVNGGIIAYEAQLIHAVINTRAGLVDDLHVTYEGEGEERRCTVSGALNRGSKKVRTYTSPMVKEIKVKNSPLWKSDPDQQLHYFATRNWARRWCPEVLLGAYTREEIETGAITDADRVEAIEHKTQPDVLDDDAIADPDEPLPSAPLSARMSFKLEKCLTEDELKAAQLGFEPELDAADKEQRKVLRGLYAAHLKRVRGESDPDKVLAWSKEFRKPVEAA